MLFHRFNNEDRLSRLKVILGFAGFVLTVTCVGLMWKPEKETEKKKSLKQVSHIESSRIEHEPMALNEMTNNSLVQTMLIPKTSTFKAFTKPPVERLVKDPKLGEFVEITMENGAKVYQFNDDVYDVGTQTYSKKNFSN